MGGVDTKGRFHVHWGPPEQYGERREESALRRSGRPVPDPAYAHFDADRPRRRSTRSSTRTTTTRSRCCAILEATQAAYGYLPVAALKHISQRTGAWYARSTAPPRTTATSASSRRPRPSRPPRSTRAPAARGDATSPRSTRRSAGVRARAAPARA